MLNCPMNGIIHAFIYCELNPIIPSTDFTNLRNFPRHLIRDSESLEVAFLVEIVHFQKSVLAWCVSVRSGMVPEVDLVSLQRFQRLQKVFPLKLRTVRKVLFSRTATAGKNFVAMKRPRAASQDFPGIPLRGVTSVNSDCVDLIVTVRIEKTKHKTSGFQV